MECHVFGPISSRRLGRSLGIDLLPYKTCSFDCVYCECGSTSNLTTRRSEFFPFTDVITELDRMLECRPEIDYITFAGSGEPTLSQSLRGVIHHIKSRYPSYPVAVLTNSSLLRDPVVREDLLQADLIVPTLTTTCQHTFECIHRPAPGVLIEEIIQGLVSLRNEYPNQIWLEIFLIPPLNTTDRELAGIRDAIHEIEPDRVQLNSLDRPGTESWVSPVDPDMLARIRSCLGAVGAPVDLIGTCRSCIPDPAIPLEESTHVEEILKKCPCTFDEIARTSGFHQNEIGHILISLVRQGRVRISTGPRGIRYYKESD